MAEEIQTIRNSLKAEKFAKAGTAIKKALLKNPDSSDLLVLKSELYFHKGKLQESEDILLNVLANDPLHVAALNNLACVKICRRQWDEAFNLLQAALKTDPPNKDAIENLKFILSESSAPARIKQDITDLNILYKNVANKISNHRNGKSQVVQIDKFKSIIFFHIPKTGGSTLQRIIEKQYHPSTMFTIDGSQISIENLKNLPQASRMNLKVLKGHMWLNLKLHKYMPQPSTYITLLRDPVERIISHYYFVLRYPQHYLYETVRSKNMSLKDYAVSGLTNELKNGQTGVFLTDDEVKCCQGNTLEAAKTNMMKYFSLVGVLEMFDEFLLLAQKIFGWTDLYYSRQNVTSNRPRKSDLSPETLTAIEENNQLDVELYNFARNRMRKMIADQGKAFVRELERFKSMNQGQI